MAPDRCNYFSSESLDWLLKRTGFRTIGTECSGFVEAVVGQVGIRKRVHQTVSGSGSRMGLMRLKDIINEIAGRMGIGDRMVKYGRKV